MDIWVVLKGNDKQTILLSYEVKSTLQLLAVGYDENHNRTF